MDDFTVQEPVSASPEQAWQTDLTREENTRYYMQISKRNGLMRLRGVLLIAMVLFSVLMGAMFLYEWLVLQYSDWPYIILTGVLLAVSLGIWWLVPVRMKRTAEKAYDEAIACGYSYAGVVRIKSDSIEKESEQGINTVPLNGYTVFMETPEMMFFSCSGRPAIVLPARYLTPEAATAFRSAADKLPYRNRVFLGRVRPQGIRPVPTETLPSTVLWERSIRYESAEMEAMLRHTVTTRFMRNLPMQALLCVAGTVGLGVEQPHIIEMAGGFLLMFLVITAFTLWMPLRRAKAMAYMANTDARTASVKITDRGVWVSHPNSGFVLLPWNVVEHVVDRDTYVDITRKTQSIRIPKRCIEDFAAFDAMISDVWKKTNSK